MNVLKLGSTGNDVKKWQYFLTGQGFYLGAISGAFDENTFEATKNFQGKYGLNPDGKVGNFSVGQAMLLGFGLLADEEKDITSDAFPPKPNFRPLASNEERQKLFGRIEYISEPKPDNPENIKIINNWERDNIIKVNVKQLKQIKGTETVYFHKKCANQLVALFDDWEKNNLLHHILTWDGAYNPRFVRGSKSDLSNHTFGTAFDINYAWNKLGAVPALVGQKGSVRELVELAHQHGFYWGGHFTRRDGMHFEVAAIVG
ncbi:hypothetical protein HNQ92_001058 [Rhabdobacter roseus]|uniref:Peptidoglycan-binding protein n=1 Tax=Rhabdobacter roseus TaxID=1655419 RepID=A0A840TN14_9BACT|nr:M15 family metallopeptidase [Rhabdobacter roseus]MBB5282932.1 hypothetical protein [Rhabdobacter roseus]